MANLSVDTHCQMLTSHIRDRATAIRDGFRLFVQMFAAVVGGTVVIRLQYAGGIPSSFGALSDALVGLIFLMAAVIIVENVRSWYRYRQVLSSVAGRSRASKRIVPMPDLWSAIKIELVMLAIMALASGSFVYFNPLRS